MSDSTPRVRAPVSAAIDHGVSALRFDGNALHLLDQRTLPHAENWLRCANASEVAQAITDMVVRGAPAIGIAAAYGMAMAASAGEDLARTANLLRASRPTAVNLHWALERMQALSAAPAARWVEQAHALHREDLAQNLAMAEAGAALLPEGTRVLTHCNTGALATGGHGTALGVIRSGWRSGRITSVHHTETRPWLQGARLTAWELQRDGIPATMIADSAAAQLMASGAIDWVIVGADRVAANGDTANKIGTLMLAQCARTSGVRFMVVAPSGTVDRDCPNGDAIPIESRAADELAGIGAQRMAPSGIAAWNPVFDVTPAALIDAFVCERGVCCPVNAETLAACLGD